MIDIVTADELRQLAETQQSPCVSIYIPTHAAGVETSQDRIRLKNAVAETARELTALGVRTRDVDAFVAPITALAEDGTFWNHLEGGLAVFATEAEVRAVRLAEPVTDLVVVADRFHVKPLIPHVASGELFYVLTISENHVRLLQGSRYQVSEMALPDVPQSLAEALWYDDREAQLQSHGATRAGAGRVVATFHGHGLGNESDDADRTRFMQAVDAGIAQIIGKASTAPVVLAGVGTTVAHYRHVSSLPGLVDETIEGSADMLDARELHDRAWPMVQPQFDAERRRLGDAVRAGAVETAETLPAAAAAATSGRVAALFVPVGVQRWGVVGEHVEEHDERQPGDRDLLDAIAVETLTHGGEVYAVPADDVPLGGSIAAALRY